MVIESSISVRFGRTCVDSLSLEEGLCTVLEPDDDEDFRAAPCSPSMLRFYTASDSPIYASCTNGSVSVLPTVNTMMFSEDIVINNKSGETTYPVTGFFSAQVIGETQVPCGDSVTNIIVQGCSIKSSGDGLIRVTYQTSFHDVEVVPGMEGEGTVLICQDNEAVIHQFTSVECDREVLAAYAEDCCGNYRREIFDLETQRRSSGITNGQAAILEETLDLLRADMTPFVADAQITDGETKLIVIGGCPPYLWSLMGDPMLSLKFFSTTTNTNTVSGTGLCGEWSLQVVDSCGRRCVASITTGLVCCSEDGFRARTGGTVYGPSGWISLETVGGKGPFEWTLSGPNSSRMQLEASRTDEGVNRLSVNPDAHIDERGTFVTIEDSCVMENGGGRIVKIEIIVVEAETTLILPSPEEP